ncbi:MAG: hypothetical protein OK438_03150 [Thaumarchaeota archaeon]|nr:hypothetical protein [Nitrososphaerota archaeon]
MSESITDGPFKSAARQVDAAHEQAVSQLKSTVEKSKVTALKKVSA